MPTDNAAVKRRSNLAVVEAPALGAEGKFRVLFEQASDAIMTVSAEGAIDEVNQAFEEMTGYLKDELSGATVSLLSPTEKAAHAEERSRPLTVELLKAQGIHEEVAVLQKDGFIRTVDVSVRPVRSGNDSLFLVLFRDVTEKKRMERELITKHTEMRNAYFQLEKNNAELKAMQETLVQAGKMAALGELAAGIAHELNQPLQGIRGYAQELQSMVEPFVKTSPNGSDITGFLKEVVSNVDKMAQIIQYLRTFTRKSVENFEAVDIHQAVEEALKMLSRQFASRGIVVHREFGKDLPKVYANPLQLEQVFINLSTNARDAIEGLGKGSGNIWIRTRSTGKFVEVSFRDDGAGMNDRTKTKIFNPFFTTKEVGKGMGLGLSLSYGILSKIHASIVVESELGKGTNFIVTVPVDFREVS